MPWEKASKIQTAEERTPEIKASVSEQKLPNTGRTVQSSLSCANSSEFRTVILLQSTEH